jgi:hypothetical protein
MGFASPPSSFFPLLYFLVLLYFFFLPFYLPFASFGYFTFSTDFLAAFSFFSFDLDLGGDLAGSHSDSVSLMALLIL